VFPALDGRRILLVEIQALVAEGPGGGAPRAATGIPPGRLPLLLAVLDRRAGIALAGHDVYVSVVGGVRLSDPGADLAVCLALVSAATSRPVRPDLVAVGEVGLGGEIRRVSGLDRRLGDATRSGFTRALVPPGPTAAGALRPVTVETLGHAIELGLAEQVARPALRLVDRTGPAAVGAGPPSAGPPSVRQPSVR
jgi:DNA repair protein RadA/Sms